MDNDSATLATGSGPIASSSSRDAPSAGSASDAESYVRHEWRNMTDNEAYPSRAGKVCINCDVAVLDWGSGFGRRLDTACPGKVKAKHTPLPWVGVPQSNGSMMLARQYDTGKQLQPKGLRIVGFVLARGDTLEEDEANAELILKCVNAWNDPGALRNRLSELDRA